MSLTQSPSARPWYCHSGLVETYKTYAREGGDLRLLKTVKTLESLIVNIGVIAMTLAALFFGEANAYVVAAGIATLGLLNGVMAADYQAMARALAELSNAQDGGESDDDKS